MVGNHGRRTVDDQLVEADISSFYVSAEGRRFLEQYWDAIDHLLDSEDQRKCSIRDVLSPCGVKSIVCVARMSFRCRLLACCGELRGFVFCVC